MNASYLRPLLLIVLLPTIPFAAVGAETAQLSPFAETVADTINFERKVMLIVKQETGENICRLTGYDENRFQVMVDGIVVRVPSPRTGHVLSALRKKLRPFGYMAFVTELNTGVRTDRIGVVKGTDQYQILRIMNTNGDRYGITNADIVERLQEWHKSWPFQIMGADNNWVEIEFKSLPDDLIAFSEEVHGFSPDSVEKGPGNPAKLAEKIKKTKRLFLMWD